jgi:hypothetical protein
VRILHALSPEYKKRARKRERERLDTVRGNLAALSNRDELNDEIEIDQAEDYIVDWKTDDKHHIAIEDDAGEVCFVGVEDRRIILADPTFADFTLWVRTLGHSIAEHKQRARQAILGNSNGTSAG